MSRSWRSLKRKQLRPELVPAAGLLTQSSAGCATGITISSAPARFISSRITRSTLRSTRRPMGSQVYSPPARRRIRPARSMSRWLTISASAGTSLRFWIGYADRRMGHRDGPERVAGPKARYLRRCLPGLPRQTHESRFQRDSHAPRDLPAAEPAHDLLPVRRLLRDRGLDRRQLRACDHRDLRRHDLRRARRAGGAPDGNRDRFRQGVRQPCGHGRLRPRACRRLLPVGRRTHRRVRPRLVALRLDRRLLLRGRGGPAPRPLQCALGNAGQALLRGAAEPVRRRHRRRFRRAGPPVRHHRACRD